MSSSQAPESPPSPRAGRRSATASGTRKCQRSYCPRSGIRQHRTVPPRQGRPEACCKSTDSLGRDPDSTRDVTPSQGFLGKPGPRVRTRFHVGRSSPLGPGRTVVGQPNAHSPQRHLRTRQVTINVARWPRVSTPQADFEIQDSGLTDESGRDSIRERASGTEPFRQVGSTAPPRKPSRRQRIAPMRSVGSAVHPRAIRTGDLRMDQSARSGTDMRGNRIVGGRHAMYHPLPTESGRKVFRRNGLSSSSSRRVPTAAQASRLGCPIPPAPHSSSPERRSISAPRACNLRSTLS